MKLRVDAKVEKATTHLERYASVTVQIAGVIARRDALIAKANVAADRKLQPLVDEAATLKLEIEPWWKRIASTLLTGKRKTLELGGCKIGSKAGRAKLAFAHGDDEAALAALQECRWAKPYIRTTYSVDKVAIAAGLEGKHAPGLKEIGFSMPDAPEAFVLEPVKQTGGTIAG